MSSNLCQEILEYLEQVESNTPRACPEQHALAAMIRACFDREEIRVDTNQLKKYLGLARYFPFELFAWQKFLIALWDCSYKPDGRPRWKTLLCMVGRGAGKDGFIAFDSACSISPYNPVSHYNVDICANNEEQAVTPVKDLAEVLETPTYEAKLKSITTTPKSLYRAEKTKG